MTEAWLLFDEAALRRAADHPRGRAPLELPPVAKVEELADPKKLLDDLLVQASEKAGRRRKDIQADIAWRRYRVGELIENFAALRDVSAFRRLEDDLGAMLAMHPALRRRGTGPAASRAAGARGARASNEAR